MSLLRANGPVDWGSPVDWSHPLNRGREVWYLHTGEPGRVGGQTFRDLAKRWHAALTDVAWAASIQRGGAGAVTGNGTSSIGTVAGPDTPFLGAITLAAWVKIRVTSVSHPVINKHLSNGATNAPFSFHLTAANKLGTARANAGGFQYWESTSTISTGVAAHVAVTWPDAAINSTPSFYINGAAVSGGDISGSGTGAVTGSVAALNILKRPDSLWFDGQADDISAWSRALNAAEIRQLYRESLGGFPETLNRLPRRRTIEQAGGATSYTLTADAGAFTLTGVAATLKAARVVTGGVGSFTLTGVSNTLKATRRVAADTGAFVLNGVAATLNKGRTLTADAGAFVLTGNAVAFGRSYVAAMDVGSFALTGNAATLTYSGSSLWSPVSPPAGVWSDTDAPSGGWSAA